MNRLLELARKKGIQPVGTQTANGFPTQQGEESKRSFLQMLTQGITSPIRRAGVQLYNTGVGIGRAATGDIAGAHAELDKERDLGYLGMTKPTLTNSVKPGARELLDVAGQGAELGSFFVGGSGGVQAAKAGFKGLIKESVKQGAKTGFQAGVVGGLGTGLQDENASVGSVALSTGIGAGAGAVGGGLLGGATGALGAGLNKITQKLSGDYSKQADDAISYAIEKGIRPSIAGKKTPELYNKFIDKSRVAVKYIAENADDLNITDDVGAKVKYPRNLEQFSSAISKAKQHVFGKYNFLKQTAGEDGAKVYLGGVSSQLRKAADNTALKLKHPEVVNHLLAMANRFDEQKALSATEADELIQLFNTELKAFYRNPQSGNANKMTVDAMIANNIRKELDDVIQNASGQNYQALKNTYGALSELEKEVAHRTVVANRANVKGLADLTDVFSASQVVQGILTGNPAQITSGVVSKGVAVLHRISNDPNKIVRDMFKSVGDAVEKSSKKGVKLSPTAPIKTMKALPAGTSPRGKQPSVNLNQINLPKKTQSTLDAQEIIDVKSTRVVRPKGDSVVKEVTQVFPDEKRLIIPKNVSAKIRKLAKEINDELNDSIPGLTTRNPRAAELGHKLNELNRQWVNKPTPANKKALLLVRKAYHAAIKAAGTAAIGYGIANSLK